MPLGTVSIGWQETWLLPGLWTYISSLSQRKGFLPGHTCVPCFALTDPEPHRESYYHTGPLNKQTKQIREQEVTTGILHPASSQSTQHPDWPTEIIP